LRSPALERDANRRQRFKWFPRMVMELLVLDLSLFWKRVSALPMLATLRGFRLLPSCYRC
jgi:hypothetical protein